MLSILFLSCEKTVRNQIMKWIYEISVDIIVYNVESPNEAIDIAYEQRVDIFILDMDINQGDSIELALEFRKIARYKASPIIFMSNSVERELEAYRKVGCYYFAKKFPLDHHFKRKLNILIDIRDKENYFFMSKKDCYKKINYDDIVFVEIINRKLVIHTTSESLEYKRIPMKEFFKELPQNRFIRIHQSIAVNKKHVKELNKSTMCLIVGKAKTELKIGSTFIKDCQL